MFETTMRRVARGLLPLILMVAGGALGPLADPLAGQTPVEPEEPAPVEGEAPIEWNFRPGPVGSAASDVSLQERWAAPFAVISQGQPAPRAPRQVVVLRDSVAARRVAAAQAASGQSVAEVTLEGDGDESAPAAEGTAAPAAAADGGAAAADDDEDEDGLDAVPERGAEEESAAATPETGADEESGAAAPEPRAGRPPTGRTPSSASGARTHRVEYGETWYGLAREYRITSRDLAAANPDVNPERLQAGTVLRIPAAGSAGSAATPGSANAAPRRHTVTRGDTLFGIARRYGVSADAIRSANRMRDDVVRLGQTLVIPREESSR